MSTQQSDLAVRINVLIAEQLHHRLQKVANANITEMWKAIRPICSSAWRD